MLAVVGTSGAGKSTLTALLAGVEAPDERGGGGRRTGSRGGAGPRRGGWTSPELARRVGWVPQQAELAVVSRTVREDVLSTSRLLGLDQDAAGRRADALLEVLGLAHLAGTDPHRLSGGEMRRLALAGAVAHGPAVLVLDEPTVGQDRLTWAAVAGVVAAARSAGVAVVLATHDPLLARLADRTVRLEGGRVVSGAAAPAVRRRARHRPQHLPLPCRSRSPWPPAAPLPSLRQDTRPRRRLRTPLPARRVGGAAARLAVRARPARRARSGRRRAAAGAGGPGLPSVPVGRRGSTAWARAPARARRPRRAVGRLLQLAAQPGPRRRRRGDRRAAGRVLRLPGVLLAARVDPFVLGDHLGQRLRLPARPVVAAVAALQRFESLDQQWHQLRRTRRVRGLDAGGRRWRGPGRSAR